jgi:hypothetical protein
MLRLFSDMALFGQLRQGGLTRKLDGNRCVLEHGRYPRLRCFFMTIDPLGMDTS